MSALKEFFWKIVVVVVSIAILVLVVLPDWLNPLGWFGIEWVTGP